MDAHRDDPNVNFVAGTLVLRVNQRGLMRAMLAAGNEHPVKGTHPEALHGAFWHPGMCFLPERRRPLWVRDAQLLAVPDPMVLEPTLPMRWRSAMESSQ